jgi:MFS-type transporter involved in bile tolerance (Atg22 family)
VTLSEVRRHFCQEVKVEKCDTKSLVLHSCLIEIWRDLKTKRDILNFYLAQFFWNFSMAAIFPFVFVYLKTEYGMEIGRLYRLVPGLAIISFSIVLLAGFLTDRWGYKKTLTLGVVLLSLFMPLNLIRGESIQVLFRLGLTMLPVLIILSQAPAYLSHLIPAGREGEFFGYDIFSITLAQIPAAWISGLMIDRFGYPIMFCLASIGALASLVYILRNLFTPTPMH